MFIWTLSLGVGQFGGWKSKHSIHVKKIKQVVRFSGVVPGGFPYNKSTAWKKNSIAVNFFTGFEQTRSRYNSTIHEFGSEHVLFSEIKHTFLSDLHCFLMKIHREFARCQLNIPHFDKKNRASKFLFPCMLIRRQWYLLNRVWIWAQNI